VISIEIVNGDAADVFVTVVDNNTPSPQKVLDGSRLNYASAPVIIQVAENAAGRGNIDWKATRCDDPATENQGSATPADDERVYVNAV
jgi:hypothetical protein